MTPLSPLDALAPAFRRTREVLASPFRLGFFLKIALVAALTQPSFYSASFSYPLDGAQVAFSSSVGHHSSFAAQGYGSQLQMATRLGVFGVVALIIVGMIGIVLWIVLAYLYCRMRFTLFDLVVYKQGRVRQAWSRYGSQAWRYFGLVILVSLAFLTVAVVIIGPALLNFLRTMKPLSSTGANINPFQLLGGMLPFLLAIFAVAALWAVVDSMMQDFLLPPLAIEDASLEAAVSRFFGLLKSDFGPVVLYVLLRFAVGIGLTWLLMLVLFAAMALGGLAIFGVGLVLYHVLWSSMAGQVICVALALIVGLVVVILYLIAIISIYGFAAVVKQSYAAYFFGGRYSPLGDLLEPPLAPATVELPEPPMPSPPAGLPPLSEAPPVW